MANVPDLVEKQPQQVFITAILVWYDEYEAQ